MGGAGENDMFLLAMNLFGFSESGLRFGAIWMAAYQTVLGAEACGSLPARQKPIPTCASRCSHDERDLIRMRDGLRRLQKLARHPDQGRRRSGRIRQPAQRREGAASRGCRAGSVDGGQLLRLAARRRDLPDGIAVRPAISGRSGLPRDRVDGLRVIDCSIMPEIVRSNTHLPVVMIAELMADRIGASERSVAGGTPALENRHGGRRYETREGSNRTRRPAGHWHGDASFPTLLRDARHTNSRVGACRSADRGVQLETDYAGAARMRQIYMSNCVVCHNADPNFAGSQGPPIAGSPRELVEARVLHLSYPAGYHPKRTTHAMRAFPQLAGHIDEITAFLAEAAATDK